MSKANSNLSTFIALFLVIIIDSSGIGLVWPLLAPIFSAKVGGVLSPTTSIAVRDLLYGVSTGIYPVGMFIGAPILGDLSDQLGRKKVMLICLLSTCVALLVCSLSLVLHSVIILLLGRVISGFVGGSFSIAQAAIIDISDDSNRQINISLISCASLLGFVIGPLLGGVLTDSALVSWFNFSIPFIFAAILALINFILLIYTYQETFVVGAKKALNFSKGLLNFFAAFKVKELKKLAIIHLALMYGWGVYIQFSVLFMVQRFNYSSIRSAHFVAWIGLLLAFTYLILVRIVVKFVSPKQMVRFGIILASIGVVCILQQTEFWQWLGVIPMTIGIGLAYSSMLTLFSAAVDKKSQGWIMGVASAVWAIASGSAGLSLGWLTIIHFTMPFYMVGSILLLALALSFA